MKNEEFSSVGGDLDEQNYFSSLMPNEALPTQGKVHDALNKV